MSKTPTSTNTSVIPIMVDSDEMVPPEVLNNDLAMAAK
jgi:hypothetical protein